MIFTNTCQYLTGMLAILLLMCGSYSCKRTAVDQASVEQPFISDSLTIAKMISTRETAMIHKDIEAAMDQFTEEATWINSQGYYFEGRENVSKFHGMLAGNDSLDYYYKAGSPRIRMIDPQNALAYYGWKMFWYKKENPADTTFREIGLMTLTAHKTNDKWQWIAVTNQHTPWFYEDIEAVTTDSD
ncbi:MAG TPA: nuclear transport factor 2 family protein [Eudoraea sp.]|nr:nuclear transport factor 2 family protein [Eudoraea sp.]